jgi:RNA polymerase sigma-70 factor (ECF subfamily)
MADVDEAVDRRSDDDLLAAARAGDAGALEHLVRRYQPRVYRFGLKMCRDPEDAGDVVQESLLAMARGVRDFRGDASLSSWLYSIARSFCIKKRRRSRFAPAREESLDTLDPARIAQVSDSAPDPEALAAKHEIEVALSAAIDSLDEPQREVLVLRDIEGLSAPEVAAVLGQTVQAVKSRLHRARLAVRQRLTPVLARPGAAAPAGPRCPDVLLLFSRHLEGELAPEVCAEMEAHLDACSHCRAACDSLREMLATCRRMPVPDVPPPLRDSVREAVRLFLQQASPPA